MPMSEVWIALVIGSKAFLSHGWIAINRASGVEIVASWFSAIAVP